MPNFAARVQQMRQTVPSRERAQFGAPWLPGALRSMRIPILGRCSIPPRAEPGSPRDLALYCARVSASKTQDVISGFARAVDNHAKSIRRQTRQPARVGKRNPACRRARLRDASPQCGRRETSVPNEARCFHCACHARATSVLTARQCLGCRPRPKLPADAQRNDVRYQPRFPPRFSGSGGCSPR